MKEKSYMQFQGDFIKAFIFKNKFLQRKRKKNKCGF